MAKPAFDPNQPFDGAKPAFDPNAKFEAPAPAGKPTPYIDAIKGAGRAAVDFAAGIPADINAGVQAMGDMAAFGYTPQLAGAAGAAGDAVAGAVQGELPSLESIAKSYQESKDFALRNQAKNMSEHPVSTALGSVAGALATPLPGGSLIKAQTMLGKGALAAGKGAAYGALMNPGDKQGEAAGLQLDERLGNAAWGAPLGVLGEGAAKALEKGPETIKSLRRYFTAKEMGANTSQMKQLLRELPEGGGMNRLDRMEEFLAENKLLNSGKTYADIEDATKGIRAQSGKSIGDAYQKVQADIVGLAERNPEAAGRLDDGALHGPDLAIEFLNAEKERLKKSHGGASVLKTLESELGNPENPVGLTALGRDASIPDLVQYRASVDDAVNWSKKSGERAPLEQAYVNLRNFLNDKIKARIGELDEALGSEQTKVLKDLNVRYADATLANKITEATKAREMAKFTPGLIGALGGTMYGGYGMAHGENPVEAAAKGVAVGLGMRAARTYAPGMMYSGVRAIEPMAGRVAEAVKQTNPGSRLLVAPWVEMTKEK